MYHKNLSARFRIIGEGHSTLNAAYEGETPHSDFISTCTQKANFVLTKANNNNDNGKRINLRPRKCMYSWEL